MITCEQCKKECEQSRPWQRFCSTYCYRKAKRIRSKEYRIVYSKKYAKEHRENDPEYIKKASLRSLAYYYRNKEKNLARGKVFKAILCGKILRPEFCSNCKVKCKPEAHHTDYKKPLLVSWFCKKCHEYEHHKNQGLQVGVDIINKHKK